MGGDIRSGAYPSHVLCLPHPYLVSGSNDMIDVGSMPAVVDSVLSDFGLRCSITQPSTA